MIQIMLLVPDGPQNYCAIAIRKGERMPIDWEELTDKYPALSSIPKVLREAARLRGCKKGELLYRLGQPPEAMLCVLNGEIRLIRLAPSGTEIILQRSRGGFIAEASLDAQAYHCDVVATNDSQLLLFPRSAFKAALKHDSSFHHAWTQLLSSEVRRLRVLNERLNLNSAVDRILHYIETEGAQGVITLNQTRKSWATELSLTHEALYRTLRQLRESGDLIIEREKISICVPPQTSARRDSAQ
jgi:CRP-like cAMP-binding protein